MAQKKRAGGCGPQFSVRELPNWDVGVIKFAVLNVAERIRGPACGNEPTSKTLT